MKRLLLISSVLMLCACSIPAKVELPPSQDLEAAHRAGDALAGQPLPVSYTHLTLPTIYSV